MSNLRISRQFVRDTPYKYGRSNGKRFITVHTTGNTTRGANAKAHANLQSNGNARNAAWHWQVDDYQAIQSFNHNFQLWSAGDGRGNGNLNSIHVEICVNRDGDYSKAVRNGAKLVKHIMDAEGIPRSNVVQHNHWSGKNCPAEIRAGKGGVTWRKFLSLVNNLNSNTTPAKPNREPVHKQYKGDSIVTYLQTLGINSSYNNRKKLASQYGIRGYKGTAAQNLQLLNNMRDGKHSQVKTPKLRKGSKVSIKGNARNYSRSTKRIPNRYKGKQYTVQQIGDDDVLIKELYSWVKKRDLQGGSPRVNVKVGHTVTLKRSASRYATGQKIAKFAKGKQYRVLQVKRDRVLLDGIMSWVKRTDVR